MEAFNAGTLAGAGSFRCDSCGFGIALHERDQVPSCPECGGESFRRSSLFGDTVRRPLRHDVEGTPEWLDEAREALVREGDYLAFEDDARVRVFPLQDGWTRIGRSLSAHVRFDDPTVSRRHALIVRQADGVRVLDDRSLNGVFVNGERVEWRALTDGDEIVVGRYRLQFLHVVAAAAAESAAAPSAADAVG
jgi:FHA domain/Zinc-ribbon containing domain